MSKDSADAVVIASGSSDGIKRLSLATHVIIPLVLLMMTSFVLMALQGDEYLAAWLFEVQGHTWAMKDGWITEQIIHKLGRNLSIGAGLVVLAFAIASVWKKSLSGLRRPLLRLFVSVALSTILVSLLKKHTGMDCPWDLTSYGGSRAFYGLFDTRPAGLRASGCFPAGHASAGYGWLALYFFALEVCPRLRYFALAFGTSLGLIFGISQQIRGAHFMSHDVWTAAICWFVGLGLFILWPPKKCPSSSLLCRSQET